MAEVKGGNMPGCLSELEARDLLGGKLPSSQLRLAEHHLDSCKACLRAVAGLARQVDLPGAIDDAPDATNPHAPDAMRKRRIAAGTEPPPIAFRGTDRFQVLRQLGQGGMGAVYEAYDRETDSLVAVKTLRRLDGQSLYMFKNEFRELTDVRHPNLLRLGELQCVDDRWFFTMEVVRGRNFIDYVRERSLVSVNDTTLVSPESKTLTNGEPTASCDEMDGANDTGPLVGRFNEGKLRDALGQLAQGLCALPMSLLPMTAE